MTRRANFRQRVYSIAMSHLPTELRLAIDDLRQQVRAKYPELDNRFALVDDIPESEFRTYLRLLQTSSQNGPSLAAELLLTVLMIDASSIAAEDKDTLGRALLALPCDA